MHPSWSLGVISAEGTWPRREPGPPRPVVTADRPAWCWGRGRGCGARRRAGEDAPAAPSTFPVFILHHDRGDEPEMSRLTVDIVYEVRHPHLHSPLPPQAPLQGRRPHSPSVAPTPTLLPRFTCHNHSLVLGIFSPSLEGEFPGAGGEDRLVRHSVPGPGGWFCARHRVPNFYQCQRPFLLLHTSVVTGWTPTWDVPPLPLVSTCAGQEGQRAWL